MATLRSVYRAPFRQLGRPSSSIASNHARLLQSSQWRGYASASDAQHKVCITSIVFCGNKLLIRAAALFQPRRGRPHRLSDHRKGPPLATYSKLSIAHHPLNAGEAPPETLHKPHSFRKLHLASCSRCTRQRHAEYVPATRRAGSLNLTPRSQTNTQRDILGRDTTEAMNTLMPQSDYASKELCKHLA